MVSRTPTTTPVIAPIDTPREQFNSTSGAVVESQDLVLETPFHHIVPAEDVGVPGCICGDYKSNHIDGAGLCRICRTFPDAPGIPCQRYERVGEKPCLRS